MNSSQQADYQRAVREQSWAQHHSAMASLASIQPNAPTTAGLQAQTAQTAANNGNSHLAGQIATNIWQKRT